MSFDLRTFESRFAQFGERFLLGEDTNDYHIDLKIRHSQRVYDYAQRITAGESLSKLEKKTSLVAALYHDTGRFLQYQQYQTFNDRESDNHAKLGVQAILRNNLLAGLSKAERKATLGAVYLHNVRALPASLPSLLRAAVCVTRDADKLDIVQLMLAHLEPGRPHNKVVTLGIQPHPKNYTQSILEDVLARRTPSYQDMRWYNDFRLLLLGWIYDLTFDTSLRLYVDLDYPERILSLLPADSLTTRLREQIASDLQQRLQALKTKEHLLPGTPPGTIP